ncbi:MAG: hypothetical protein IVW51_13930 [Thermaceae bacterium]|nr:hypothetical protein [Thermaceae bacterium]
MEQISRVEAAKAVLERVFDFETQMMYIEGEGDAALVWMPESVQADPELSAKFTDPDTGGLRAPNQLCILVPDSSPFGWAYASLGAEERGIAETASVVDNAVTAALVMPHHNIPSKSWQLAPDVFTNPGVLEDLIQQYGLKVRQDGANWTAEGDSILPATAATKGEAIVLAALRKLGIEDVTITP